MIISRLILRNWRNFHAIDVTVCDRVFIVGPNAAGKSNFLDALRFLRDVARPGGGLQWAVRQRGGLSKIRCLAAPRDPKVEIEVELSEGAGEVALWRYRLSIGQEVRGRRQPLVASEQVWDRGALVLNRPDSGDAGDRLRRTQTHLEQVHTNTRFRPISQFFESIRYLHFVPQLLRHPEAVPGSVSDEDPFGRRFLEAVARTPEKIRRSRLAQIEGALRVAVPQLKELTDTKDEAGVPHLEVVYEHWKPNAGRQREDQFSDGTLRLIALFWSLLDGNSPLLLEEPELSLHSLLVAKLPSLFGQVLRNRKRQVFATTHSWEMLSDKGIGGEEVLLLRPGAKGTSVDVAASVSVIRRELEAGLSVADVLMPRTAPAGLGQLDLFR